MTSVNSIIKAKLTLHVYNDPGHGWVRVKRDLLRLLGIEQKITAFSYQNGRWCYLEEDCDAGVLIEALKANQVAYETKSHYCNTDSRIRSYESFKAWPE